MSRNYGHIEKCLINSTDNILLKLCGRAAVSLPATSNLGPAGGAGPRKSQFNKRVTRAVADP
jgi:hypothetical protein